MWIIHLFWYLGSISVIGATLLSALRGKAWWMRIWDFPRIQVLFTGIVFLMLSVLLYPANPPLSGAWIGVLILLILSIIQQTRWAVRMTPLVTTEVPGFRHHRKGTTDQESTHACIRVIASNVDYTNTERRSAIDTLNAHNPNLMALVEVDEHWDSLIESCAQQYPHRVTELRGNGRGMALLSGFPLEDAEVQYLVEDDRPSIWAKVRTEDHGTVIGVCVLHPPPPGLMKRSKDERVSSKPRDIELMFAAKSIAESSIEHWIVIGDFNDVGWSRTTEQAKKSGGLRDPRVGRGMFNTFPAKRPLLRYPIDHVLATESFRVDRLARLEDIGSDHLPLLADLVLELPTQHTSE